MSKRTVVFFALATASWLIASVLDLKTSIEVTVWNGRVEWKVGSTTLTARTDVGDVTSISINGQEGMHPTGGGSLEATTPGGLRDRWRLPSRFSFPASQNRAVGDWWVDEATAVSTVFSTPVELGSDFTLRGVITGRHHQYLGIELAGSPGIICAYRRGLLNNDLLILDDQRNVLVSGSLDPQPMARVAAISATVFRALSGGALLLALWSVITVQKASDSIAGTPRLNSTAFVTTLVVLSVAGAGLAAWTALDIFDGLPHLPDEIVYQLQGRWLLSGHLTGAEPLCSDHFMIPLTYFHNGRWIGHYPPAWPLLLAPGILLGAPWLAPTLLRVLHIILVALLGLRLGGRWTGLAAAAAALASPLALLLFGSRMPHAGSATCLLAGILFCLPRTPLTSRWRWLAAGVSFGLAFGMRPLTAVAVALPVGLYHLGETLAERRRWRDGLWLIVAGLGTSLPTLMANNSITGSPWSFPYSLAEGSMYSIRHAAFGLRNVDALIASLEPVVHGWGWPWLSGPVSQALPFAFVAALFLSRRSTREDRLLAAVAVGVVLAHLGTRATGLHGFGPRYLFIPCAIVWILTARGAAILAAKENRTWPVAGVLLTFLTLSATASIPQRLSLYRGYNDIAPNMTHAASSLPECSLVLFPNDNWRWWAEASPWLGLQGDHLQVLFAADRGETLGLEWCYPDRWIFRWTDGGMLPAFDEGSPIP